MNPVLRRIIFVTPSMSVLMFGIIIGCTSDKTTADHMPKPVIAVSIVPQAAFIKAVAGEAVDVLTLIPLGNSPANYEPTPKELVRLSEAQISLFKKQTNYGIICSEEKKIVSSIEYSLN